MNKRMKTIVVFLFFIFSLISLTFSQDSLTITTYYPSPYGSYRELGSQRMAIGTNYYDHAQYCWEGAPTCTNQISNADLVVQGNVGIGTPNPSEKLDVEGRMRLGQTIAPGVTTDKLYNVGGTLYWNGAAIGGGGLQAYAGSFSITVNAGAAAPGPLAITGLGFKPKAISFTGSHAYAGGQVFYGTGLSTQQNEYAWTLDLPPGPTLHPNSALFFYGGAYCGLNVISFDNDGFTVQASCNLYGSTRTITVSYLALG